MIKKLLTVMFLLILLSGYAHSAEKGKIRIGIMDLKDDGVSKKTAKAVTNMLRTEFVTIEKFIIVERSQVDSILKEQGLQNTGCTEQSCAIEMGKLMSAKKILIGEISSIGTSIMITVRIVDVENGISEFASSEKASSEDTLDIAAKEITRKFVAQIEGRTVAEAKSEEKQEQSGEVPAGYYIRGFIPGMAQVYSGHWIQGSIFATGFCASAITTVIFTKKYNDSKKQYEDLAPGLPQSTYDDAFDKYKNDGNNAKNMFFITAGIYCLNWLDVLIFTKPVIENKISGLRYDNTYVRINNYITDGNDYYNIIPEIRTDLSVTLRF